jgi:hypothetical protein
VEELFLRTAQESKPARRYEHEIHGGDSGPVITCCACSVLPLPAFRQGYHVFFCIGPLPTRVKVLGDFEQEKADHVKAAWTSSFPHQMAQEPAPFFRIGAVAIARELKRALLEQLEPSGSPFARKIH